MLITFCLSANLLVVSQLMCSINTSALTTSIVSSSTSVITTVASLFLLGLTLTPMFVYGVIIAMSGVIGYMVAKIFEIRHKEKQQENVRVELVDNKNKNKV